LTFIGGISLKASSGLIFSINILRYGEYPKDTLLSVLI